jgi:hypothetical protein
MRQARAGEELAVQRRGSRDDLLQRDSVGFYPRNRLDLSRKPGTSGLADIPGKQSQRLRPSDAFLYGFLSVRRSTSPVPGARLDRSAGLPRRQSYGPVVSRRQAGRLAGLWDQAAAPPGRYSRGASETAPKAQPAIDPCNCPSLREVPRRR